jgi:hypothetical protein
VCQVKYLAAWLLLAVLVMPAAALPPPGGDSGAAEDEAVLRRAGVATGAEDLLAFVRKRSLTPADWRHLDGLLGRLGDAGYAVREQASREIIALGPAALPLLRQALAKPDLEVARRAERCVEAIEAREGPGEMLTTAVVRLLARRRPLGTVEALLGYAPFAADDTLQDEILAALGRVGVRSGKAAAPLVEALEDPTPARRASAAYVLGRSPDPAQREDVRHLLTDDEPWVRLRAAQGLAVGRDRTAVPTLVSLLGEAAEPVARQAEEFLFRIAGADGPPVSLGAAGPAERQRCREAWAAWWGEHGGRVDLAHLAETPRHLGLTLVVEVDHNQVWEYGPDGRTRWKLEGLQVPMDAQVLPGGRVLVAEYQGKRVTERDLRNTILWEQRLPNNPVACQRLPNGNTFIATHGSLFEVTRSGKEVYSHACGPGSLIVSAQKLANGRIVCVDTGGTLRLIDATTGREVQRLTQLRDLSGWCGVEALPGRRYLVAQPVGGKVLELDAAGKVLWECAVPGLAYATRRPNGHTVVATNSLRKVIEVDRAGKTVAEVVTTGRPFRVHVR